MSSEIPTAFLRVSGNDIVDGNGRRVILKGVATGGHTNMENFITGYPGHEHEMRAALLEVLGQEKYNFFFNKFLEYFFTAEDAKFLASLGFNAIRVPFNHRHFFDDDNPSVIKDSGFKLLDRMVNLCAEQGLYTILDLHTAPGGQNQAWHCDAGIHKALFWDYKDHQDRVVELWIHLAKHYTNNSWVAGYNPLNEPADPQHTRLQSFYSRIERAIREFDPNHILFLDGNTYAMDFTGFKTILPNSVYAIHDYSTMGFPAGVPYKGTAEQKEVLQRQYERKVQFMKEHGVPVWNGEFGPVYASEDEVGYREINEKRYKLLGEQLSIYQKDNVSWSIWVYKDIGFQGMVYVNPNTPYIQLLGPFLEKKKRLAADKWGRDDTQVRHIYDQLKSHIEENIPEEFINKRYPQLWRLDGHVSRVLRETLLSELLTYEYASYFEGKSFEELDALAASFKLENCIKRERLNEILRADAGLAV